MKRRNENEPDRPDFLRLTYLNETGSLREHKKMEVSIFKLIVFCGKQHQTKKLTSELNAGYSLNVAISWDFSCSFEMTGARHLDFGLQRKRKKNSNSEKKP